MAILPSVFAVRAAGAGDPPPGAPPQRRPASTLYQRRAGGAILRRMRFDLDPIVFLIDGIAVRA